MQKWVPKESHGDNHYLDAEVYALAAADTLGVRMLHLETINAKPQAEQPKEEQPKEVQPAEAAWIKQNESWIQGG
jgi:phage terminase large subunit GpA-like protein